MPVREKDPNLELVTREYVKGKTITRTVAEWRESDKRIAEILQWNKDIEELSLNLQKELNEVYETESISITAEAYNRLDDNLGFERFVPRNYLSYEKLKVANGSEILNYYFGRFLTVNDLVETLKQDIYVKRKPTENTGSNESDTGGDGDKSE